MSRLPLTLGVAAGVVVLDQVTKAIAVAKLEGEPPIEVLGQWLQLTFVRNPGAAFSLAGNYTIVISVIAIIVAVAIVRTARTLTNPWWAVVLGGILGGAVGNLIDRIFREPAAVPRACRGLPGAAELAGVQRRRHGAGRVGDPRGHPEHQGRRDG